MSEQSLLERGMKVSDDIKGLHEPVCFIDRARKETKDESKPIAMAYFYWGWHVQ